MARSRVSTSQKFHLLANCRMIAVTHNGDLAYQRLPLKSIEILTYVTLLLPGSAKLCIEMKIIQYENRQGYSKGRD